LTVVAIVTFVVDIVNYMTTLLCMARRHSGDNATSAAAYLPDLNFAVGRKGGREKKEERSVAAFRTTSFATANKPRFAYSKAGSQAHKTRTNRTKPEPSII
jgi:hypothetical protein